LKYSAAKTFCFFEEAHSVTGEEHLNIPASECRHTLTRRKTHLTQQRITDHEIN
jgi:hypothetical protein